MNTDTHTFKNITEVSKELKVPQYVLRFWEKEFRQISPVKRKGGRRFYRTEDVETIRQIKELLYDKGYTIKGAKKLLGINSELPLYEDEKNEFEDSEKENIQNTLNLLYKIQEILD